MPNCYDHKCDSPGCDEVIPMHLADFATNRGNCDVKVYCERHAPEVEEAYDYYEYSDELVAHERDVKEWTGCAVVLVSEYARKMARFNHPNAFWHRLVMTVEKGEKN